MGKRNLHKVKRVLTKHCIQKVYQPPKFASAVNPYLKMIKGGGETAKDDLGPLLQFLHPHFFETKISQIFAV